MHELSIAQNIIQTLKEKYPEEVRSLKTIRMKIGDFSGVVEDSLDFCLQTVLKSENMRDVQIILEREEAIAQCICGNKYVIKNMLNNCPKCHSLDRELISGRDVLISSIEIEEKGD